MSRLWEWALEAWARPGVADAWLALQDAHGQNAPLLLWVAWAAQDGRAPDLARGAALAAAYEAAAGAPLRQARRALKPPLPGLGEADQEDLRRRVKAVELDGERLLMAALAELAPPAPADRDLRALLVEAAAAYGAPLAPSAFDALLVRL